MRELSDIYKSESYKSGNNILVDVCFLYDVLLKNRDIFSGIDRR